MAMLMKSMLEIEVTGKKLVVLGEMFELGECSQEKHEQLGEMVANTDIEAIWFVGPSCRAFEAGLKRAYFEKTYFIFRYLPRKSCISNGLYVKTRRYCGGKRFPGHEDGESRSRFSAHQL
jgi:hypothetical protein